MKQAWRTWTLVVAFFASPSAFGCNKTGSSAAAAREDGGAAPECVALPPAAPKSNFTVGFVQLYEPGNPFTPANTADIVAAAAKRGRALVYDPPKSTDPAEQAARVQALIAAKVDAIILRPESSLGPSVIAARKACIPVFLETRKVDSAEVLPGRDYVAYIGSSPSSQGQAIAEWLIKTSGGKATIVELEGPVGSSQAVGRKKGFDAQIAAQPEMKIVASRSAHFDRDVAHEVTKALLVQYPTANVIYAHSDTMALGALAAVRELHKVPGKDVAILAIGGVREAIEHVIDGSIAAVAFSDPRLGALTFAAIEKYFSGDSVPPEMVARGPVIDRTNAETMISEAF
jgi:ribose transport system substrate-binding protein